MSTKNEIIARACAPIVAAMEKGDTYDADTLVKLVEQMDHTGGYEDRFTEHEEKLEALANAMRQMSVQRGGRRG
jgi:hypothetical protein